MMYGKEVGYPTLANLIKNKQIHYGDPPNIGCCSAGPTENCIDIKVLEFWRRKMLDWERDSGLEIDLSGD
jgi:hypothetical protein